MGTARSSATVVKDWLTLFVDQLVLHTNKLASTIGKGEASRDEILRYRCQHSRLKVALGAPLLGLLRCWQEGGPCRGCDDFLIPFLPDMPLAEPLLLGESVLHVMPRKLLRQSESHHVLLLQRGLWLASLD